MGYVSFTTASSSSSSVLLYFVKGDEHHTDIGKFQGGSA